MLGCASHTLAAVACHWANPQRQRIYLMEQSTWSRRRCATPQTRAHARARALACAARELNRLGWRAAGWLSASRRGAPCSARARDRVERVARRRVRLPRSSLAASPAPAAREHCAPLCVHLC